VLRSEFDKKFYSWVWVRAALVALACVAFALYVGINLHVWLIQWAQGRCLPLLLC